MDNYEYDDYEKEYEIFFEYMTEFIQPEEQNLTFTFYEEGKGPKQIPLDDLNQIYNQNDLITELEFKIMMGDL